MVMPSTKQMASRMLDLPDPLSPVIALKRGSKPGTTTRDAYDLKPSMVISEMCMVEKSLVEANEAKEPARVFLGCGARDDACSAQPRSKNSLGRPSQSVSRA